MKKILLTIPFILLLTSCSDPPPSDNYVSYNRNNINNPEIVGIFKNKYHLKRIHVHNPTACSWDSPRMDHYIYYFEEAPTNTITMNKIEQSGKTYINKVQVIIDGKTYIAVEKEK